jgi:hypothetical protein
MNVPNIGISTRPRQKAAFRHRQIHHDVEIVGRILYLVLRSLNHIAISPPRRALYSMPRKRRARHLKPRSTPISRRKKMTVVQVTLVVVVAMVAVAT